MTIHRHADGSALKKVGVALAAVLALAPLSAVGAAPADAATSTDPVVVDSADLHTWWQDGAEANASGPVAADHVRQSTSYRVKVATASAPDARYDSFAYMSIPRSGKDKVGYTDQDGAEFAHDARLSMSWSSFEYAADVWVDVQLTTGEPIASADQVTIRPSNLAFEKQLVDSSTIRVKVPYSEKGYRFSVEFAPQLYTAYNDMSGASGALTTESAGNRVVHTEPRNSIMIFAQPKLTGAKAMQFIPSDSDGSIYRPQPGLIDNLASVTADIVYFEPGTYYMGADLHAVLSANVRWVYLAPGAYVKGAFQFPRSAQTQYKVTGYGVLSGEQYVYEPDTANGYQHRAPDTSDCHGTCVKMLQFESSNAGQTLDLQGVTINEPPYHSFVTYAHDSAGELGVENFRMHVSNYQQVGSWYWQTDGIELYSGSTMENTFFHSNDDVLKMYHSDVQIDGTVIWKNENGPVIQWGWTPRTIDNVTVADTDVIHNRMYWKDVKYNTCVFNSSSAWQDMGATDRADPNATITNMRFVNTRVEGATNCAIRVFALSNMQNIEIDGLAIDEWNGLDAASQASMFKTYTDATGTQVSVGDEATQGNGLLLHNYRVGGVSILKAGANWASDELGRLNFDADTWDGWDATSDDAPIGDPPALTVDGTAEGTVSPSRDVVVSGTTDAATVSVTVNGVVTPATVVDGTFSQRITLNDITNRIVVVATGENGVQKVERRTVTAYGTLVGLLSDPSGDDKGSGSYTYPTDGAFNPGSLDLTGLRVYRDTDTVRFVISTAGVINNPWGGNGMSTQRVNVYLRDGSSSATTPMLPGTNTSTDGAWKYAVVADGRFAQSRFGGGLFTADHQRTAAVDLEVDPRGAIIASVPASALGGVDLASAGYQVSMFSGSEESEGVGNVRPIYSAECAQGAGCPWFVGPYRGGGGVGEFADALESRDTDTSDSNAFDLITGTADQSAVMDWTRGAVVAPFIALDKADAGPADGGGTAVSLSVKRIRVGNEITVTGTGFDAREPVELQLRNGGERLGVVVADAGGTFTATVTVPTTTHPGNNVLDARGAASGTVNARLVVTR